MADAPTARHKAAAFTDLSRWLRLHDLLASLDPDGPPLARALPGGGRSPTRLAVLAGSFNPLTYAHTELAERACRDGDVDGVAFALSVRTVNKEHVTGAALEDRLIALELAIDETVEHGVVLFNRGLYVDQAQAMLATWPSLDDLAFIVGFDKVVQIFDARYYPDRDAALDRLFALARLLVAPRADQGLDALDELCQRSENRRYAGKVRWLPLPTEFTDLSSTQVREQAALGAAVTGVPRATRALLAETNVYGPPHLLSTGELVDAYDLRLAVLVVLARTRPWADSAADLPGLLRLAFSPNDAGQRFRAWLTQPPGSIVERTSDLAAFQAVALS
jgi:nicotinic acid mononucleotide adenylyltransferase